MEEHERDKVEQNALQVRVENPSLAMTSILQNFICFS